MSTSKTRKKSVKKRKKKHARKVSPPHLSPEQRSAGVLKVLRILAAARMDHALVMHDKGISLPTPWCYKPLTDYEYRLTLADYHLHHAEKKKEFDAAKKKLMATSTVASSLGAIIIAWLKARGRIIGKAASGKSFKYALTHQWPRWKDASPKLKMAYWQAAIDVQPAAYAFTVNLGEFQQTQALVGAAYFVDGMRRSIERKLRRRLKRTVPFWFVVEATREKQPRIHLHGSIALNPSEVEQARAILLSCSGVTDPAFKPYAVRIVDPGFAIATAKGKKIGNTLFWASGYALKHIKHTASVVDDEDVSLAASSGIKGAAQALYKHDAAVHAAHYTTVNVKTLKKMYAPPKKRAPRKKKKTAP